jgi:hypothetical protein
VRQALTRNSALNYICGLVPVGSNIGNANLFGLSTDLGLSVTQYGVCPIGKLHAKISLISNSICSQACLAIFFAFYVLFEVPSNMVMKAWR